MLIHETNDMLQSSRRNCHIVTDADATLALQALAWTLSDADRAHRLLAITGLDANQLRDCAADASTLAAVIVFLANHEADLVACAGALGESPARLATLANELVR